jgi:hypothetical protein
MCANSRDGPIGYVIQASTINGGSRWLNPYQPAGRSPTPICTPS